MGNEKHLIICGGSEESRNTCLDNVIADLDEKEWKVYELPSQIKSRLEFIDAIRTIFPIKSPIGKSIENMSYNQISDVLLDWTEEGLKSKLIVWREIEEFESKEDLHNLLNDFSTQKYMMAESKMTQTVRLMATCKHQINDYYKDATIYFGRGDSDISDAQVAKDNLEIIKIDNE